jgi:hypothetical protein
MWLVWRCTQGFVGKNLWERGNLIDLGIDGWIILKLMLRNSVGGVDWIGKT